MVDSSHDCDVLILGASFAGMELLYRLRRSRAGRALKIIVVDRQAEHGYIPLIQERLTLRLSLPDSALPTGWCVQGDPHARFVHDEVVCMDSATHEVTLASGTRLRGRFVVVALGSLLAPPPGLIGHQHLLGYKFADEFVVAQRKLMARLERPGAPHVVVIGGGISGVELAGELAHLSRKAPPDQGLKVTLVDGGDRLLRGLTLRAGRMAARQLTRQGVTLRLRTRVLEVGPDTMRLHTAEGEPDGLTHDGAFWAGGIRAVPVLTKLGLPTTERGYLAVTPTLQPHGHPGIFVCGDAARVVDETGEWPTMQRAIECIWEAGVVAHNLVMLVAVAGDPNAPTASTTSLRRLKLRRDFPHGVSIGAASMIVFGWLAVELGFFGVWFRRFLMRMYFRRYGAPGGTKPARRLTDADAVDRPA